MKEREQLEQAIVIQEQLRGTVPDSVINATISAIREKLAALEASFPSKQQRKQATILFADVSGFTALSETMDAEEVNDIMNALWEKLDKAITDHNGRIDKHIGDAVMAIWGADVAREDDPEQAIRAGLAMQTALTRFRDEQYMELAMRIGINTGPVLLGEVATTAEYTAIGDTVNTASRLEHAAPLNGILISHETYQHVRGMFEIDGSTPIRVKGKQEPLQVYTVKAAKQRGFRMGRRGVEGVETRMIGRDAELKHLQSALFTAVDNEERQMVTIVGEAGVGKSRLLFEFEKWLERLPETIHVFKGRARLETRNHPYALVRDLFSFHFQIQESDPTLTVQRKLEIGLVEALPHNGQAQMKAHLIGQLIGFDFRQSPHLQTVQNDARQLRDRSTIYLRDYFQVMAIQNPIAILLEDIHWADDSSLDLINQLARSVNESPLVIICATRPTLFERRPHWAKEQDFHTLLDIRALNKRDSRLLVADVLQKVVKIPDALRELIVGNAEGNPFYVEELVKMLIQDGVIERGEPQWQVNPDKLVDVRVPATLTGVLQARLDSLPPTERVILQQASVVGRIFWDMAVNHIVQSRGESINSDDLQGSLLSLRAKDLIFRRESSTFADINEYIFKNAVLRDVIYESVLLRLRRAYHALIADWLIEYSGERVNEFTGLIADHLELAGDTKNAIIYLRHASERAIAHFANNEAIGYLSRALNLTPADRLTDRYELLRMRERVYEFQGNREEQRQDLNVLEELSVALDDKKKLGEIAVRQAIFAQETGNHLKAIRAAQRAIKFAQANGNTQVEAEACQYWGLSLWGQGKLEGAELQIERALELARSVSAKLVEANCIRLLAYVATEKNEHERAIATYKQALALFRKIGDRDKETTCLNGIGVIHMYRWEYPQARHYFEQALQISQEIGARASEAFYLGNLRWVFMGEDNFEEAKACGEKALSIYREIDNSWGIGRAYSDLGQVFEKFADYDQAEIHYERAWQMHQQIGAHQEEIRVLIFLGKNASHQNELSQASQCFHQALALSREKELPLEEGWAAALLGLVYRNQGAFTEAKAYLDQALEIFERIDRVPGTAWTLYVLGILSFTMGDFEKANLYYGQANTFLRQIDHREGLRKTLTAQSLLHLRLGDNDKAKSHIQEALSLPRGRIDPYVEGYTIVLGNALIVSGHVALALGQHGEATRAYQKALKLHQKKHYAHLACESWAGLARIALAKNNLKSAIKYVGEILDHLERGTLEGTLEPERIYWTCYQVLTANGDGRAQNILKTAYNLIQERATNIEDMKLRHSYLENISANREIVQEYKSSINL